MNIEDFFNSLEGKNLVEANKMAEEICGIEDFFETSDFCIDQGDAQVNKVEYGDWQTNFELAARVCLHIKEQGICPKIVIEPTCGTGTFILAACAVFGNDLEQIYGIEIYKPYINQLKLRFLKYALENPGVISCKIKLFHQSIFEFDFDSLHISNNKNVLLLGNPPWVTNSKLGEINSANLPKKTNFKNVKGLEAITGKGNFDIAEYITYQLLDKFHQQNACLAFLIKCSVAKNIVYEQKNGKYKINSIMQYNIDAKKEFDVSVAACLMVLDLGKDSARQCVVQDFYKQNDCYAYGWVGDYFVANIEDYSDTAFIDGTCPLKWWSGMKHDCSKVMELDCNEGKLYNKLHELVEIENDLVYPLLKSSDIKGGVIDKSRKYIIVTQTNTSDDTEKIKTSQPLTYKYLDSHSEYFNKRGSIIYKKRPKFCIFGIGSYSFKKYKIAIAGLYKSTSFSLVFPIKEKCAMLDDTCYLMGFDTLEDAECVIKILNGRMVQRFMQSLVFYDAKRSINKDLLMRIDISKAAKQMLANGDLSLSEYQRFSKLIEPENQKKSRQPIQKSLFECIET